MMSELNTSPSLAGWAPQVADAFTSKGLNFSAAFPRLCLWVCFHLAGLACLVSKKTCRITFSAYIFAEL